MSINDGVARSGNGVKKKLCDYINEWDGRFHGCSPPGSMEQFHHSSIFPRWEDGRPRNDRQTAPRRPPSLHGYHLAYRDLNPVNTFFARYAPDWWIKLGDFGIVRRICTEHNSKLSLIGIFDYMALEILEEQNMSYTLAVDIWSLGCVLFRLLTQQLQFSYWTFAATLAIEKLVSYGYSHQT